MDRGPMMMAAPPTHQERFFRMQMPSYLKPPPSLQTGPTTQPTVTAQSGPVRSQMVREQSGVTFDGKRMRKAVYRKTVDYNSTVVKYIQNRIWQRDHRDFRAIQPDVLYQTDLGPPLSLLENPMNCVTTRHVRTSTNKFRCPIFCLAWTPEGRRLVTGASSGEFTLWNGLTFNFETILQAHDTSVRAMVWSHNDNWMITGDHAGFIKYWQTNMNNVKMFQGHKEPVRDISFCPTDNKFATCSDDGTVRIWDFLRCHEEKILRGHGADVKSVDWHPQKSLLASGSKDNQQPIKLWDPKTGNSLATLHAHKSTVMQLKWNKNGNWLITASRDHLLKLFDIRNMKEEVQTFKGHKKEATAVSWHPIHESLFTSGGSDGAILFWMVGTDREIGGMEEAHDSLIWSMSWHPMGHILVSGSNDHSTKFWTRNRPGDKMRDKYNLNTLPAGSEQEMLEFDLEPLSAPNIPGMGMEQKAETSDPGESNLDTSESADNIPGLDWENDEKFLRAQQINAQPRKKVPKSRPIPRDFEKAWMTNVQTGALVPDEKPSKEDEERRLDEIQNKVRQKLKELGELDPTKQPQKNQQSGQRSERHNNMPSPDSKGLNQKGGHSDGPGHGMSQMQGMRMQGNQGLLNAPSSMGINPLAKPFQPMQNIRPPGEGLLGAAPNMRAQNINQLQQINQQLMMGQQTGNIRSPILQQNTMRMHGSMQQGSPGMQQQGHQQDFRGNMRDDSASGQSRRFQTREDPRTQGSQWNRGDNRGFQDRDYRSNMGGNAPDHDMRMNQGFSQNQNNRSGMLGRGGINQGSNRGPGGPGDQFGQGPHDTAGQMRGGTNQDSSGRDENNRAFRGQDANKMMEQDDRSKMGGGMRGLDDNKGMQNQGFDNRSNFGSDGRGRMDSDGGMDIDERMDSRRGSASQFDGGRRGMQDDRFHGGQYSGSEQMSDMGRKRQWEEGPGASDQGMSMGRGMGRDFPGQRQNQFSGQWGSGNNQGDYRGQNQNRPDLQSGGSGQGGWQNRQGGAGQMGRSQDSPYNRGRGMSFNRGRGSYRGRSGDRGR